MTFDLTPREYESEEVSTGSRTIDPGQSITIGYDDFRGFYASRTFGALDASDLFGELNYWPKTVVWSGTADRLSRILGELLPHTGLSSSELREIVVAYLEEYRGVDAEAFLSSEEAGLTNEGFEADSGRLRGQHRIPAFPSYDFEPGTFYRGLELVFDENGWKATLLAPDMNDERLPSRAVADEWEGDTFDELLTNDNEDCSLADCLAWTREEFVAELVDFDGTWRLWCALGSPTPNENESCEAKTRVDSVLLHVPHSSTKIPDDVRAGLLIDAEELERELSAMTDRHTDELFSAEGADRLVFGFSRLVVDPERFEDDAKEPMAARGMGAVYTKTSGGKPLRSGADRAELMARYYEPHHRRLNEWAGAALARHGCCLVIDCHSFPSSPLACDLDPSVERPMFCIGTDPFHTPPALRDAVVVGLRQIANEMLDIRDARDGRKPRFANRMKRVEQAVLVDRPYAGTMVPSRFCGTDARVASVMIEVNRGLYMDEATGQRNETYALVRERLGELLEDLAEAWREQVVR